MSNRLASGGPDPRSETERRLAVAGTIELRHPTPRPGGFFGERRIPSEFCSARCTADGCDVTGQVPATLYEEYDRAEIRYVVRCSEHAAERRERLERRREYLEANGEAEGDNYPRR